jgi:hypothetical protein
MNNVSPLVVPGADSDENVYALLRYARTRFAGLQHARLGRIVGDELHLEGRTVSLQRTMGGSEAFTVSLSLGEGVCFLQLLSGQPAGPGPALWPGSSAYEIDIVDRAGTLRATTIRVFAPDLEAVAEGVLAYSSRDLFFAPEEVVARAPRNLDDILRRILAEFDGVLYGYSTTLAPQLIGKNVLRLLEAEDPNPAETFQLLERLRLLNRLDQLISLIPHTSGLGPFLRLKQVDWEYVYANARVHINDFGSFGGGLVFGGFETHYEGLRVFALLLGEGGAEILDFFLPGEKGAFHKEIDRELIAMYRAMTQFFTSPLSTLLSAASETYRAWGDAMWNLDFFEAGRIFGNLIATLDMLFAGVTALPALVEALAKAPAFIVRLTVAAVVRMGVELKELAEFMQSFAPRGLQFQTATGVRMWAIPNAGQLAVAHAGTAGLLSMDEATNALWRAGYALKRAGAAPPPLTDPAESARDTFKKIYEELYEELKRKGLKPEGRRKVIRPDKAKYPTVEIRPNGDVVGRHDQLLEYLRDVGATGRHSSLNVTIEAHHLLEKGLMKSFGITTEEGIAIAVEASEHEKFTSMVPAELGATRGDPIFYDIDDLYRAHRNVYANAGHLEWVADLRDFLRANRDRLLKLYETGRVPGAKLADFPKRLARVRKFLLRL